MPSTSGNDPQGRKHDIKKAGDNLQMQLVLKAIQKGHPHADSIQAVIDFLKKINEESIARSLTQNPLELFEKNNIKISTDPSYVESMNHALMILHATHPDLLNMENFKVLHQHEAHREDIAHVLCHLFNANIYFVNQETRRLISKNAKHAAQIGRVLRILGPHLNQFTGLQTFKLIIKNLPFIENLEQALNNLNTVTEDKFVILAEHAKHADIIALALNTGFPLHKEKELRRFLIKHREQAQHIIEILALLEPPIPDEHHLPPFFDKQTLKNMSQNIQSLPELKDVLVEVRKVCPTLVSVNNFKCLVKHAPYAKDMAYIAGLLHEVDPTALTPENRMLLDRNAKHAKSIADGLERLRSRNLANAETLKWLNENPEQAEEIGRGLCILDESQFYTPEHCRLIIQNPSIADDLVSLLKNQNGTTSIRFDIHNRFSHFMALIHYGASPVKQFNYASHSRTLNAEINRRTAKLLVEESLKAKDIDDLSLVFTPENVQRLRRLIIKDNDYRNEPEFVERDIHSDAFNTLLHNMRRTFLVKAEDKIDRQKEQIKYRLKAYIARVESNTGYGFFIDKTRREKSRQANLELADKLLSEMDASREDHTALFTLFNKQNLSDLRQNLITDNDALKGARSKIKSNELNEIIAEARQYFSP